MEKQVTPMRQSQQVQLKQSMKRPILGSIKYNSRNSQSLKKQEFLKRTVSITQFARRLSAATLNKKVQEVLSHLGKISSKDKHLMTAQIKCFMMGKYHYDSHLLDQKLSMNAIDKIKNSHRLQQSYDIKYAKFIVFSDNIIKKCGDSETLINSFEQCMQEQYPPTVCMMLIYLGVFLYSINSQYEAAERYCQKLFDMIVKYKVQEFFIIYLLLRVKLKTNLSEWQDSLTLLTKLVYFSWMYNLVDLEIWCYFELSRVYFFLQMNKQSEIFKMKSQINSTQPRRSIYREVSISNLIIQIQAIWQGQLDFKYDSIIQESRLVLPSSNRYGAQEYIADQRKLKTNIKSIIQDCKIRHVSNLLSRMGQIGMHSMQKQNMKDNSYMSTSSSTAYGSFGGINTSNCFSSSGNSNSSFLGPNTKSGNNFLLTHQSYNKNMNMFFRKRCSQDQPNQRVFYTIQNSQKNWGALKEMLKNIFVQMTYFTNTVTI